MREQMILGGSHFSPSPHSLTFENPALHPSQKTPWSSLCQNTTWRVLNTHLHGPRPRSRFFRLVLGEASQVSLLCAVWALAYGNLSLQ